MLADGVLRKTNSNNSTLTIASTLCGVKKKTSTYSVPLLLVSHAMSKPSFVVNKKVITFACGRVNGFEMLHTSCFPRIVRNRGTVSGRCNVHLCLRPRAPFVSLVPIAWKRTECRLRILLRFTRWAWKCWKTNGMGNGRKKWWHYAAIENKCSR